MTSPPDAIDAASRRERSVARVLHPARQKAEERVQRFLDAALELQHESGSEFTLQDVVERAGLSLRSFYQHFTGKHELLLALFEDAVRRNDERLREHLAGVDDPLERLKIVVVEYYLVLVQGTRDESGRNESGLTQFGQTLLAKHPQEASAAFLPIVTLFEEVLGEAVAAGAARPGRRPRRIAAFLMQTVLFNAYVATLVTPGTKQVQREAAEDLWDLLARGLQA